MIFAPSPIRSPLIGADGKISPSWAKWFSAFYQITGPSGPANNDDIARLDTLVSGLDARLDVAEINIDALQAADVSLDARIDALEAAPGVYAASIEYDFGSTPVYDSEFTITDAAITNTSIVLVTPGGAATGRTADDWRWDGAAIGVVAGSGTATCYVTFSPGPIVGKRKFNYTVI